MQVTVSAGELAGALRIVRPAVSGRTTIPILQHVLLEAEGEFLFITSTNLETAIRTSIKATVIESGATTTNEAKLSGWVGFQDGATELTLKADQKSLHLATGRNRARLGMADAEDFPPLPAVDSEVFDVPAALLTRGIALTLPSTAKEADRPVFRGLHFVIEDSTLKLTGADGYRLGHAVVDLAAPVATRQEFILPRQSVAMLAGLLKGAGVAEIEIARSQARFTLGQTQLYSGLIDGAFPEWQRLVATDWKTSAIVQAAELEAQVRAAQLAGLFEPVCFRADPDEGSLAIWAREADVEHEGVIAAEVTGESLEMALNSAYTLDAIQALRSEQIELRWNGPVSPVLFTTPGAGESALLVVVTMHIRGQIQEAA